MKIHANNNTPSMACRHLGFPRRFVKGGALSWGLGCMFNNFCNAFIRASLLVLL